MLELTNEQLVELKVIYNTTVTEYKQAFGIDDEELDHEQLMDLFTISVQRLLVDEFTDDAKIEVTFSVDTEGAKREVTLRPDSNTKETLIFMHLFNSLMAQAKNNGLLIPSDEVVAELADVAALVMAPIPFVEDANYPEGEGPTYDETILERGTEEVAIFSKLPLDNLFEDDEEYVEVDEEDHDDEDYDFADDDEF